STGLEVGVTELVAFPPQGGKWRKSHDKQGYGPIKDGDRLVLVFCTRRSLAKAPPYEGLDQCKFYSHMDLGSDPNKHEPRAALNFSNAGDLARYGGTVENPELIRADVT